MRVTGMGLMGGAHPDILSRGPRVPSYARVVHGSDGPAGRVGSGRVGSGRVTILTDFGGSGRVGSALWIF